MEFLILSAVGILLAHRLGAAAIDRQTQHAAEQSGSSRLYVNPAPRAVPPSTRAYLGPSRPRSAASRARKRNR